MAGPYTVDASVFLSAFNRRESTHADSFDFLRKVQERAIPIVVPTLLLPEVAGAIGRGHRDATLAAQFATTLRRLPHLMLIDLDAALAEHAAGLAAQHRLRGSDAVYALVALRFAATLVTLDREQRQRVEQVLATRRPSEELRNL